MNEYNWHNWGTHTLWWMLWIAVVVGLWLIYRYVKKSVNQNEKGKNGQKT